MADAPHDKLYGILLDVQKQIGELKSANTEKLGALSRETGEQTKKLDSLNDKVSVANGRTGKLEANVIMLKEWRKYILGGFAVITMLGVYLINAFTKDIVAQTSKDVISALEEKYELIIK